MNLSKLILIICITLCLVVTLFLYAIFNIATGSPVKDLVGDYFIDKTFSEDEKYFQKYINDSYLDLDVIEILFQSVYYEFNEELKSPCQFYSKLWEDYFENKGYDVQNIFIDGHTFIIAEKDNHYYLADQIILRKTNLS